MVDFQQFPNQFVELLNYCDGSSNAFACIFEVGMSGEGTFKIVQQNQFKASDHLKLLFKKGNDETIKKLLSEKLKEQKLTVEALSEKSSGLEHSFQKCQETNEQLMFDI
jgi:hypothetical protein